jgi:hypothetical protein
MKITVVFLAAGMACAQTTRYPGALDSDSSLFVVSDNVQTTLTSAMSTSDTAAVVASGTGFTANMIATICDTQTNTGKCTAWEHMLVTSATGNVLTVTRGFAGTAARSHTSGRLVSVLIDSAHQKVLKDSVIAIQTALGPNLTNVPIAPMVSVTPYNFTSQTPGGSLPAGACNITMNPVPPGVVVGDTLRISGGTGAAETITVSALVGSTIAATCANSHSGAWTVASATGGIQEAICALPAAGGEVVVPASVTLYANVTTCGKSNPMVQKMPGVTFSGTGNIFNSPTAGLLAGGETNFLSGPTTWNVTFPNYYQGLMADIGGYPLAAHHNGDVIEAVVGSVNTPSSSTGSGSAKGGAFYSRTASTITAAVALYSQAGAAADKVAVFGGNTVAQMCDGIAGAGHCNGDGSGFSGTKTAVWELNGNNYRTDSDSMVFLNLIGGSTRQATNQFDAVAVAPAGAFLYTPYLRSNNSLTSITVVSAGVATVTVTTGTANALVGNFVEVYGTTGTAIIGEWSITAVLGSTQFQISVPTSITVGTVYNDAGLICIIEALRFKNGINILPGSADVGINLQERSGNGIAPSNSAPIFFTSNDGTTRWQSQIYATQNGLQAVVPVGKSLAVSDVSGAAFWSSSLSSLSLGNTTNLFIPAIKSTTGQRYVCVTTTGQVVSSASACSGS